jgi:hypothetical protein
LTRLPRTLTTEHFLSSSALLVRKARKAYLEYKDRKESLDLLERKVTKAYKESKVLLDHKGM